MIASLGIAVLPAASAWGGLVGLVVEFTAIGTGLIGTPGGDAECCAKTAWPACCKTGLLKYRNDVKRDGGFYCRGDE